MTRLVHRARWSCWWPSNCRCRDCICRRCSNSRVVIPPQTIISLPVQHCRVPSRAAGALVVLVAVQLSVLGSYLPPVFKFVEPLTLRPRRSFRCQSRLPCDRSRAAGALVVLVAVQLSVLGLYLPPVLNSVPPSSAPDDHFTAGPDCRVPASGRGRIGGAGGRPTIGAGIVSPAGVQCACHCTAPDDHFTAGPDCRVRSRAAGALVSVVGVHVSSVQTPEGLAITGSW